MEQGEFCISNMEKIMRNKLLALAIALSISTTAMADNEIVLPSFHKLQTGIYQVRAEPSNSLLSKTGVALEVFNPGERVLRDGSVTDTLLVFGGFYNSVGEYVTITTVNVVSPTEVDVVLHDPESNEEVGYGTLKADPNDNAEADVISFEMYLDSNVPNNPTLFKGNLERNSDAELRACFLDRNTTKTLHGYKVINPRDVVACNLYSWATS